MHIDHKTRYAAASASFCVRYTAGTLAICCGLLGASGAMAAPPDGGRRDEARPVQPMREMLRAERMQQYQADPRQADPRQAEPRQPDPRSFEGRAEEPRRALQDNGHNAERRAGRLTPDERRDLRRQINEVGQDIYAHPPHR
ncbi:hypothetical protein [Rugamonas apoptosis]|uniref:Lipoprotein n=1 Tax=Rugamonas apoptosis TaxID=2758570 RepID=A0A7W2FCQ7_9BURK|nr:hypothetical protein [Rugamonas apoptosis]MBA5689270.1 hypothetical protein [Rugamonas apoptosis]